LEATLKSFCDAQQHNGMDGVFFKLGLKKKMVNLQIPLAFVIGDIQGRDYICCRPPVYTQLACWICQTCDATPCVYCEVQPDNCQCLVMQDVIDLVQHQEFDNLMKYVLYF